MRTPLDSGRQTAETGRGALEWRLRDYLDLTVITATHGLSDGFSSILIPVLTLIVADLGLSTFEAGVLLSVKSVSTFLFLYPLSMLADATGRKKEMLIVGLSLAAGAYLAMGAARSLFPIAVLAFLAGAGNATYHPCGTALTAKRFESHKAIAISFHGLGGNIGTSLMPLLQSAIVTIAGWRTAVGACALPAVVLLPLIGIRFAGGRAVENSGERGNSKKRFTKLTARVVKNRYVVLLALIYALKGMGSKGMIGFLPLLAAQRFSMDTATIGVAVSVYYTVGIVSKPMMGYLYSRWGARLALLVPLLATGVFALGIGFLSWAPALIPLIALLGAVSPISPIILTAAADLSDEEVLASSVGLIYTCYGLGFLSPLIGGWLATRFSLASSYLFFALVTWAGACVSVLLAPAREFDNARVRSG